MIEIKEIERVFITGERWILYEITTTPDVCIIITTHDGDIITCDKR